ncbi:hypothetical protein NB647_05995 [Oxalobacter aliiformigenes]|uniref:hypothetical protein n=1 Tax=Oxalobacter aliiformigenes TaxID=2946593 RepID=UPI0022AF8922|nr:hypothetical protein [Oxalobacter aliiformigenes]WAV88456.1 hypothetical protein NB647_05995 [Oxalobacter aliiformigenes]
MSSRNDTKDKESRFQRSMQLRHLIMLSLGGVLGSGLFSERGTSSRMSAPSVPCWLT